MTQPDPLRIAVVGAGAMGRLHTRVCTALDGVRLAAIVDRSADAGRTLAAAHGVPWFVGLETLAPGDYDAAIICTPTGQHLEQATWLVAIGKHVLVEKPHRLPWEDPAALIAALRVQPRLVYMVGMTHRFYPEVVMARAALAAQPIGDLLAIRSHIYLRCLPGALPDWYFQPEHAGGGVLITNGVHCLDRILWLSGRRCTRVVAAYGRTLLPGHQVEDLATVLLELEPSVPVQLTFLWTQTDLRSAQLELLGGEGLLRINAWQGYELYRGDLQLAEQSYPAGMPFADRVLAGLQAEVAAFVRACRYGEPSPAPLSDLEEASRVLGMAYALMSNTTGSNES
jgi:predicted dehydrogenase